MPKDVHTHGPRYVPLPAGSPAADFITEGMGKGAEMVPAGVSNGFTWLV